ncbi:hypothetical protein AMECASPLE_024081 [Ameca splendens]|uniref:Uncharacterized protein n=1 Tax=Ameca splendens TaxID=208324 RepID=A0ABV1AAK0_9TELE
MKQKRLWDGSRRRRRSLGCVRIGLRDEDRRRNRCRSRAGQRGSGSRGEGRPTSATLSRRIGVLKMLSTCPDLRRGKRGHQGRRPVERSYERKRRKEGGDSSRNSARNRPGPQKRSPT